MLRLQPELGSLVGLEASIGYHAQATRTCSLQNCNMAVDIDGYRMEGRYRHMLLGPEQQINLLMRVILAASLGWGQPCFEGRFMFGCLE